MKKLITLLAMLTAAGINAQTSGDILTWRKGTGLADLKTYTTPVNTSLYAINGGGAFTLLPQSTFVLTSGFNALGDARWSLLGHTHLSSQITDASTGGGGSGDAGKVVIFGADGNLTAISGSATGVQASSNGGLGLFSSSNTHGAALFESNSTTNPTIEATINGSGDVARFNSPSNSLTFGNNCGLLWTGTGAQTTANSLPAFGSSTKGVVPASGGGTTNFLRADGQWEAPTITAAASEVSNDSDVIGANVAVALNRLLSTDGNHDNSIAQLNTAVNGKAEASHTHTLSEITDAGAGANLDRLQVTVGSGQTTSSTTPVDITGCSLILPANKTGSVTIRVLASNSSTSGGIGVTINGSTAATYIAGRLDGHQSAGNYPVANITAFGGGTAAATVAIANTVYFYTANFDVVAGASPITLTAQIFRGGSAGTITIRSARMTIQY